MTRRSQRAAMLRRRAFAVSGAALVGLLLAMCEAA
jgi:hypothetical protein